MCVVRNTVFVSSNIPPTNNFIYTAKSIPFSNGLALPRSSIDKPITVKSMPPDTFIKVRKPSPEKKESKVEPEGVTKKEDSHTALKIIAGIAAVALVSLVVALLIQHHIETTPPSKPNGSKLPFHPPEPPKPDPNPSNPSSNHGSGARPTGSSPIVDLQEEIEKLRRASEKLQDKAREEFEQQQKKWAERGQNGPNYSSPFPPDFDDSWEGYGKDLNSTSFGTYKPSSTPFPNLFEDLLGNGFWDDILNGSWSGSNTGGSTRKPPNNSHQPKSPHRGANQSNSTNSFNFDDFNANHGKDGAKGSSGSKNNFSDFLEETSQRPEGFDWLLGQIGLSQQQYEALSLEDLKKARKKLFKKLHPDKNRDKSLEEQQRIEESFKRANNVLEWMEKDKGG
jgi:hypothetical protein